MSRSVLPLVLLAWGCSSASIFVCRSDADCVNGGTQGRCEATTYCSFPDPSCPNAWRYGSYAGGGLGGQCVGETDGGDLACVGVSCPGGSCRGGVCCQGCWQGATCRTGDDVAGCGTGGGDCQGCDDQNMCTADRCTSGVCAGDPVTGLCTDGVCAGGVCHCGAPGEPCCAMSPTCEGSQVCMGGTCGGCGAPGQPCCPGSTCAAGALCSGSTCIACGGPSQPCSNGVCNSGGACISGTCQGCGALGEPCCTAGSPCTPSYLGCSGGTCQPCFASVQSGQVFGCARRNDSTVWCWGQNLDGNGDGTTARHSTPTEVLTAAGGSAFTGALSLSVYGWLGFVTQSDSSLWGWGQNGGSELGDGTTTDRTVPVAVLTSPGGSHFTAGSVVAGINQACARKSDSTIWCWGFNGQGAVGDGTTTARSTPVHVLTDTGNFMGDSIAGGGSTMCSLVSGNVWCWGANTNGMLGIGSTQTKLKPVEMTDSSGSGAFSGALAVTIGADHTCVLASTQQVYCSGDNSMGWLGTGSAAGDQTIPKQVVVAGGAPLSSISQISANGTHTCALSTDGTVWCWGDNTYGQLGDGTNTSRMNAVQVVVSPGGAPLANVAQISAGGFQTCALQTDGTPLCWGQNTNGQLGNGTTTSSNVPVVVSLTCQ